LNDSVDAWLIFPKFDHSLEKLFSRKPIAVVPEIIVYDTHLIFIGAGFVVVTH